MSSASLFSELSSSSGTPTSRRSPEASHAPRPTTRNFSLNLASVLNDPKLPRPHDMFTRDWGEAFVPSTPAPSATLKGARKEDFLPYLQRQEETLAKLQRLRTSMSQESSKSKAPNRPNSPESIELASIPAMFFSPDFDLAKRDTYASIMLPADSRMPQLTHSRLQHERLSHYLDIIEMHLALKIAQRSDRFLGALSSHEALRTRVQSVLDALSSVRERLAASQAAAVTANLRVLHLVSRRNAMVQLLRKLSAIQAVHRTQGILQQLLAGGEYTTALDHIDAAQARLQAELTGVHCLRHVGMQLGEMRRVVEALMDQECVTAMLDGVRALIAAMPLRHPIGSPDPGDSFHLDANLADRLDAPPHFATVFAHLTPVPAPTLDDTKGGPNASPAAVVAEEHASRLAPALLGLARQGRVAFVAKYCDSVGEQLKMSIKQNVMEFFSRTGPTAADMGDARGSWAESMRGLPFRAWMQLLLSVFESCLVQVHAVSAMHAVLRAIVKDVYPDALAVSSAQEPRLALQSMSDTSSLLGPASTSEEINGTALGSAGPGAGADVGEVNGSASESKAGVLSPVAEVDENQGVFDDGLDELDATLQSDIAAAADDVDLAQLERPRPPAESGGDGSGTTQVGEGTAAGSGAGRASIASNGAASSHPVPLRTVSTLGLDEAPLPAAAAATTTSAAATQAPPAPTATTTATAADPATTSPEEHVRALVSSSARGMVEFGHQTHVRCAKLLSARVKDGADAALTASQFIELFQISHAFVQASEQAVGSSFPELRGALLAQAKRFLDKFHARQREKLLMILSNENWSQVDVPNECQAQVDALARTAAPRDTAAAPTANMKEIVIVGQPFRAVGSLLMFLKLLAEYCKCAQDLSILAADIYTRIADVLRMFNSQTFRLVLRAEALQVVGLRTITARHLALSAQALGAILALVPPVQTRFRDLLPDKMHILLGEFAGIPADYEVHRKQIFSKLASIMEDVWARNVKEMSWGKGAATAGVRAVAKSAVKLHTTIAGILAPLEMTSVFEAIVAHMADKLLEAIRARDAKDKLFLIGVAADVLHIEEQLGPLSSVPVELLRRRLADTPLTLPPYVPATPAPAAAAAEK